MAEDVITVTLILEDKLTLGLTGFCGNTRVYVIQESRHHDEGYLTYLLYPLIYILFILFYSRKISIHMRVY